MSPNKLTVLPLAASLFQEQAVVGWGGGLWPLSSLLPPPPFFPIVSVPTRPPNKLPFISEFYREGLDQTAPEEEWKVLIGEDWGIQHLIIQEVTLSRGARNSLAWSPAWFYGFVATSGSALELNQICLACFNSFSGSTWCRSPVIRSDLDAA